MDTEEVLLPIEEELPLLFIIALLLEEEAEEGVHQKVILDPGVDRQEEHPSEGVGVQSEEVLSEGVLPEDDKDDGKK